MIQHLCDKKFDKKCIKVFKGKDPKIHNAVCPICAKRPGFNSNKEEDLIKHIYDCHVSKEFTEFDKMVNSDQVKRYFCGSNHKSFTEARDLIEMIKETKEKQK